MQEAARGGRVVVDESSMLGHKDALRLFKLAEKLDLKLILVGDPMQHGSVPRGALMRVLKEYGGIKPFRLTEIMRQEAADYRAAAKLLSEGDTLERLRRHRPAGLDQGAGQRSGPLPPDRGRLPAKPWRIRNRCWWCPRRTPKRPRSRTRSARLLRDAGKLGGGRSGFTRLVAVNTSEAERGQATTYRPGDVIQFHENAKGGSRRATG